MLGFSQNIMAATLRSKRFSLGPIYNSIRSSIVESGVVRVATEEELTADESLITGDLYIVLTIKNSNEKLFIPRFIYVTHKMLKYKSKGLI